MKVIQISVAQAFTGILGAFTVPVLFPEHPILGTLTLMMAVFNLYFCLVRIR